jgi:predicted Fe-Mo cluster-binding NifX family protein
MPRSPWPAGPRREAAILQRLGRAALGARGDGALRRVNCTTACSSLRYRADTTTRSPTLGPACSPCNTPTPSRIPGPQTQPRPHTPSPRTWRRPAGRRRRPALRAGPIVRPPRFARRGPTKEAHRRAFNQPDGLLHSEQSEAWGPADWFRRGFHGCRRPPKVRPCCQWRPTGRTRSRGVAIVEGATVSVAVVASRTEAELIVGMLRSHGVSAVVSADDAAGQYPQMQLDGVRVLVAPSDEASARQLLAAAGDDTLE